MIDEYTTCTNGVFPRGNTESETSLTNKINQELIRVQGNEEWRAEYMTLEMLKKDTYDSGFTAGRNEGISIGLSQGEHKKAIETAKNALTMNLSIEQVAILTGLSPEEIEKL